MSVLPYLPAGEAELPAERFVIFADASNRVQRFDESERTYDGEPFESYWESSTLNQSEVGRVWRFTHLWVLYFSELSVEISWEFSADGGETWVSRTGVFRETSGTRLRSVDFYPAVFGEDIRFRARFPVGSVLNIVGFSPRLRRAGRVSQSALYSSDSEY